MSSIDNKPICMTDLVGQALAIDIFNLRLKYMYLCVACGLYAIVKCDIKAGVHSSTSFAELSIAFNGNNCSV